MKKVFISLFILFASRIAVAQTPYSPIKQVGFGFNFGLIDFTSPAYLDTASFKSAFKNSDITHFGKMSPSISLSYWKGLNKYFDLSARIGGVFYEYLPKTSNTSNGIAGEAEATINARPVSDNHLFSPFITAGIGAGYYNRLGGYIPVGIGFQFNIQSQVYIMLQSQYRMTVTSNIIPKNLYHSIGIIQNVGNQNQSQVSQLPAPPAAVVLDRDNDGVLDSLDRCPDSAGLAALQGCPDQDGDGIADVDDKCPGVAGLAKYTGCPIPDSDGDGINDEQDKCPNVSGVARYQGCPVPDTDKDGVNDEEDKCPAEAGPTSNFGCPIIDVVIMQKIKKDAQNIFFRTGSAQLLARSYTSLKDVLKILKGNRSYKIQIDGYTDDIGDEEKNQKLSESRANSIKEYLVKNGINERRITATGHGEADPVASNNTAAGRAKNRRVEITLTNY